MAAAAAALEVEAAAAADASLRSKVDRQVLPFFFAASLLCSLDRGALSFAALQLNADLGFSPAVYGLGSGLFFLGYMALQVPAPALCARVGAPRFLGAILVAWGAVAALFACVRTPAQFLALRVLLGLAESGAYPSMWLYLARFYGQDLQLGSAYALLATGAALSGVVGGLAAAALLSLDGLLRLRGWQWLFLAEGAPAVALGVAIAALLPEGPATAAWLSAAERARLLGGRTKEVEQQQPAFWRSWRIWYLGLEWLLIAAAQDATVAWGPLLIDGMLGGVVRAALLSVVPVGTGAACMLVNARLAERARERNWHGAAPVAVAAVSLAALPPLMGRSAWAALAALTVAYAGMVANQGPLLSWPAASLTGTNAAAGSALVKMTGALGSFLGLVLVGVSGYAVGLASLAAALVLGAVMHLFFRELASSWLPPLPYFSSGSEGEEEDAVPLYVVTAPV